MRRIWLWFWLAVIIGQLASLWLVKRFVPPFDPVLAPIDTELVDLARETVEAWNLIGPVNSVSEIKDIPDSIVAREEWLLRIRDAEQAALGEGLDIRISEDLQSWLRSSTGSQSGYADPDQLVLYLMRISSWLTQLTSGNSGRDRERLSLAPDLHSDYPALHFELEGDPAAMAAILYQRTTENLDWQLRELELIRQSEGGEWWLRGSCTFRDTVSR